MYGDVTPEELSEFKKRVDELYFDSKEPVDAIFTEINDLNDIATIAKNSLTQ